MTYEQLMTEAGEAQEKARQFAELAALYQQGADTWLTIAAQKKQLALAFAVGEAAGE